MTNSIHSFLPSSFIYYSYLILSYLILSYLVLSYLISSYPILSYLVSLYAGEALQRVALGLSRNPSVTAPELLLYLHATLKPFVVTAIRDKEAQKRAKGSLIVTASALLHCTHFFLTMMDIIIYCTSYAFSSFYYVASFDIVTLITILIRILIFILISNFFLFFFSSLLPP
jgi:hypothetical protein